MAVKRGVGFAATGPPRGKRALSSLRGSLRTQPAHTPTNPASGIRRSVPGPRGIQKRSGPIAVTHDRAASSREPLATFTTLTRRSLLRWRDRGPLGSTFVKVAGPFSLPPSVTWSVTGGAPSSLLWGCSAGASDLPRRAHQDLPSPGSPATAAPSRPATHASDSTRDDQRHRS